VRKAKANPKLVFLYGPPGVGKLTVAKELAKLTGFKLFYNHLTIEPVKTILPSGHSDFIELLIKLRLDILEVAAKNNINCILTGVFAAETDEKFTRRKIKAFEKYGGSVFLVKLTCSREELYKRVRDPSRKKFSKVNKVSILKKLMDKHALDTVMKFKNTFVIDNTKLRPKKTAEKIIEHYKLPCKK